MIRGVINGKAGKAAALPKFSDTLTISQSEGADYAQPLALPHLKCFRDYAHEDYKHHMILCIAYSCEFYHALLIIWKSTFCQKFTVHKAQKFLS